MKIIQYFLLSLALIISSSLWSEENLSMMELYKDLHSNPELSYKEERTSKKLALLLRELGYEVTEGIGGYGVVAHLKNGIGKTILIRADMDALPVEEKTGASYASKLKSINQVGQEVFTMHACGHDIHMTVLMGTANYMAKNKEKWQGDLILVLQPAEEVSGGARNMIKDGLFKKWPRPDYNLALHVSADIQAGKIGYLPGWAMANVDSVDIIIKGIGGHGAYPHKTKDPIVLTAQIINSLQTIISREIGPIEPAVLTVGSVHGGTKHNIIPNEVRLQLTLRSYTDEVRSKTISSIKRLTRGLAISAGIPPDLYPEVILKNEYTPAVFNNPDLVQKLESSFKKSIGSENIFKTSPVMGGEDFGMFGRDEPIIPTAIFWLGAVNKDVFEESKKENIPLPSLHSDLFLPDAEPTINTGITAMSQAAIDLFREEL
ncbi:MAG TPA: amidohydrolase [Gammaproteobacteria bacterium]|jgi:hippurate hydrolase|nr:amidohydrolase [Gammaproteobacteria bacterium]HIK72433.1 amidohydrolase [Gammaproteobacteria bacterium]